MSATSRVVESPNAPSPLDHNRGFPTLWQRRSYSWAGMPEKAGSGRTDSAVSYENRGLAQLA